MKLAYDETGAGPALLIVHGLFGSATNWRSMGKRFATNHRVIRVDQRNHGRSPWSSVMNYQAMADDLLELMDDLALSQARILGHSMGGKTAMTLALAHAERVSALIVADIAPVSYAHDLCDYIGAMRAVDLEQVKTRADADALLSAAIPEPAIRAFLIQNLRPAPGGGLSWRINLDALHQHMNEITGFPQTHHSYSGPSLFIHGENSGYLRDAYRRDIFDRFPQAQIKTIANAGHWLHAEQPNAFFSAVAHFLENTP